MINTYPTEPFQLVHSLIPLFNTVKSEQSAQQNVDRVKEIFRPDCTFTVIDIKEDASPYSLAGWTNYLSENYYTTAQKIQLIAETNIYLSDEQSKGYNYEMQLSLGIYSNLDDKQFLLRNLSIEVKSEREEKTERLFISAIRIKQEEADKRITL